MFGQSENGAMKVTIHSTLNEDSNNEAFAIDNVKLSGSGGGSGDLDYETSLLKKFEMQVSAKIVVICEPLQSLLSI